MYILQAIQIWGTTSKMASVVNLSCSKTTGPRSYVRKWVRKTLIRYPNTGQSPQSKVPCGEQRQPYTWPPIWLSSENEKYLMAGVLAGSHAVYNMSDIVVSIYCLFIPIIERQSYCRTLCSNYVISLACCCVNRWILH